MNDKPVVDKCPIHNIELIVVAIPMGEKHHVAWCPQCEQRIPINLSYTELLKEYLIKKAGMDEFAESCQHFEGFVEVLKNKLASIYNNGSEKFQQLIERAQKSHIYWGGKGSPDGSPNVLDIIYHKCHMEVVEDLRGSLKRYLDGEMDWEEPSVDGGDIREEEH